MHRLLDKLPAEAKQRLKKSAFPGWVEPMLATLTKRRFSNEDWIFERKLDGVRCLVYCQDGEVELYSRNRKLLNNSYPEIVEAVEEQSVVDFIADGEIVAFEGSLTSFSKLQNRMHIKEAQKALKVGVEVFIYIFDVLHLGSYDTTRLPQQIRKGLAKDLFEYKDPLRYMPHRKEVGEKFYREACSSGLEGIIAKDAKAAYVHGRSRHWLKFKCVAQQELVIGGFTEPSGSRSGFGAILVGYYHNGDFKYAGKVGTGYDERTLKRLHEKMSELERAKPAFAPDKDLPRRDVHWVKPELVAEIGFEEWTRHGKLRQPRYMGLRTDKAPKEVVREEK